MSALSSVELPSEDLQTNISFMPKVGRCGHGLTESQRVVEPTTRRVFVDPGLLPLVRHTDNEAVFRVWLAIQDMSRRDGGAGWLHLSTVVDDLPEYGIAYTRRHIRRLIEAGDGTFWTLDAEREKVFLTGKAALWQKLSADERIDADLLTWVRPSRIAVLVDLSGTIKTFNARMEAAWLAGCVKPETPISRERMAKVLNVSRVQLWQWEKQNGVEVTPSEAAYSGTAARAVPDHAELYAAKTAAGQVETRQRWTLPNTYHASVEFKQVKRKAERTAYLSVLEERRPVTTRFDGQRRYFQDTDVNSAFKKAERYARKRGKADITPDPLNRPLYVFVGTRYDGTRIYERVNEAHYGSTVDANERRTQVEQSKDFRRLNELHRAAMAMVRESRRFGERLSARPSLQAGQKVNTYCEAVRARVCEAVTPLVAAGLKLGGVLRTVLPERRMETVKPLGSAQPRPTASRAPYVPPRVTIHTVFDRLGTLLSTSRTAGNTAEFERLRRLKNFVAADDLDESERYRRAVAVRNGLPAWTT